MLLSLRKEDILCTSLLGRGPKFGLMPTEYRDPTTVRVFLSLSLHFWSPLSSDYQFHSLLSPMIVLSPPSQGYVFASNSMITFFQPCKRETRKLSTNLTQVDKSSRKILFALAWIIGCFEPVIIDQRLENSALPNFGHVFIPAAILFTRINESSKDLTTLRILSIATILIFT